MFNPQNRDFTDFTHKNVIVRKVHAKLPEWENIQAQQVALTISNSNKMKSVLSANYWSYPPRGWAALLN